MSTWGQTERRKLWNSTQKVSTLSATLKLYKHIYAEVSIVNHCVCLRACVGSAQFTHEHSSPVWICEQMFSRAVSFCQVSFHDMTRQTCTNIILYIFSSQKQIFYTYSWTRICFWGLFSSEHFTDPCLDKVFVPCLKLWKSLYHKCKIVFSI